MFYLTRSANLNDNNRTVNFQFAVDNFVNISTDFVVVVRRFSNVKQNRVHQEIVDEHSLLKRLERSNLRLK